MNKLLKEARSLLASVRSNAELRPPLYVKVCRFLERTAGKPSSKGKKAAAQRKAKKAIQHRDSTASIRDAVFQRAGPCCENCGVGFVAAGLVMDHWLGGAGRRRQRQSIETCWVLCVTCNHNRTYNLPSVEYWNERFRYHCERRGFPFVPHIEHFPIPAREQEGRLPLAASASLRELEASTASAAPAAPKESP